MTRNAKYLGLALAGVAIGVLAGLLMAPAPGRETRRKLSRRISEEKEALVRTGHRAADYVQERLGEGRRRFSRESVAESRKGLGAA